jgi:hypothetical protein
MTLEKHKVIRIKKGNKDEKQGEEGSKTSQEGARKL